MATLLQKVSTLVTANLHALVDQALKSNSLAVIDQYLRQVEEHLEELEDAAATVGGSVKSLQRNLETHHQQAAKLDQAIDAFLLEGNEAAASASQNRLNSVQASIEAYQEQLPRQAEEYQKLLEAKIKLEARHALMRQQRAELQTLLELAQSKEIIVKTVKRLDDLLGSGDSDVSQIAQSICRRLDKATAASEMYAAGLDEQMDRTLNQHFIHAQLAERKKKLALAAPEGA
jgi:phage shock protein A